VKSKPSLTRAWREQLHSDFSGERSMPPRVSNGQPDHPYPQYLYSMKRKRYRWLCKRTRGAGYCCGMGQTLREVRRHHAIKHPWMQRMNDWQKERVCAARAFLSQV